MPSKNSKNVYQIECTKCQLGLLVFIKNHKGNDCHESWINEKKLAFDGIQEDIKTSPPPPPAPVIQKAESTTTAEKQYVDSNGNGLIKGNINSKKEIYHMPSGAYDDRTDPEMWFKTEIEAQERGFRRSQT